MKARTFDNILFRNCLIPIILCALIVGLLSPLCNHIIQYLLLFLFAVMVSASAAFFRSMRISKKITEPIMELCQDMKSLQTPEPRIRSGCFEINRLCEAYRTMLIAMKQQTRVRAQTAAVLKQAELSALRSQINSRFIFDTMESIKDQITDGNNADATLMLTGLSTFLHSSLPDGNPLISLKQEIRQAVSCFQIQQLRCSSRIKLELDLPEPLPDYRIVKLILQPFIENSIVHGFPNIDYTGILKLSVSETSERLTIRISDNGSGNDIEGLNNLLKQPAPDPADPVNFYSVPNVYQRLKTCYGQHFTMYYEENSPRGIAVCISIEILALKIMRS